MGARELVSGRREVQLTWFALMRAMKKKFMSRRDLYEKLDADGKYLGITLHLLAVRKKMQ